MSYIQKLLSTNEQILIETRKHLFVLMGQVLKELLILLVVSAGLFVIHQRYPGEMPLVQIALCFIAIVVLISMMIDVLRWQNEEFYVTNRRVIHSNGIFSKKVLDSSLSKINDVILIQSWVGRLFGYGTIKILTATEEVINLLDRISRPIQFKHAMLDAKAQMEPIGVTAGAPAASATQLLDELSQLRAKNVISEEEYEEKRKEILKRM